MPICVLKRGDLCDRMSSRENEARLLHQNEVKFPQASQCKHKIGLAVSHCRPRLIIRIK